MVSRIALGSFWKHWGAVTLVPRLILADSWSEINCFKEPRMAPGGLNMTVATKSMIFRGKGDLAPAVWFQELLLEA
jgi:hypothetical protein